jgi:hypothetical protein
MITTLVLEPGGPYCRTPQGPYLWSVGHLLQNVSLRPAGAFGRLFYRQEAV